MQVYRMFFKILNRHKGQVIMYLFIFMAIATIVSTQASKSGKSTFEKSTYSFSVFDEDNSEVSRSLVTFLVKQNEKVDIEDGKESIQDELYARNTNCVLRIPKGFGASLEQGSEVKKMEMTSIPGTVYGESFENQIDKYISLVQGYMAGGFSAKEALVKAELTGNETAEVVLADEGNDGSHSAMYYFFLYIPYIFISVCVVGIGPILIVFHKKEVRDRNNCSSYPLSKTNMELFAGAVTAGLGLCVIYALITICNTGTDMFSFQGFMYCMNMICFLVISLGFVFCLGQMLKKSTALSMLSNIIGLGLSFLGGVFVPLEMLGAGVVRIAHFLPSYWYVVATARIDEYVAGNSIVDILVPMGIELLFGIALVSVGLAYSRVRMSSASLSSVTE